jgi:diadenosine tetraphosphatase ApaH/serine/threonine PP2A family protein phosphatase
MLIALLSDIHANREALAACLAHAKEAGAGRYVFLGDLVGYNADPGWVLDVVMDHVARGAVAVMGNHDAAVDASSQRMNEMAQIALDWTRTQLSATQRDFLCKLPLTARHGERLFVHASAYDPAGFHYVLDPGDAAQSLEAVSDQQVFCGHVHVPALYHLAPNARIGGMTPAAGVEIPLLARWRWLAVLGSVGQPRDRNPAAAYALLDDGRNTLTCLRVPYDVETAARKVRDAGLPLALSVRLEHGY